MFNVIVGELLVGKEELFGDDEIQLETEERFLPKILVELGLFSSNGDVRRKRKDLFIELNEPTFKEIKIGKRRVWLAVGK